MEAEAAMPVILTTMNGPHAGEPVAEVEAVADVAAREAAVQEALFRYTFGRMDPMEFSPIARLHPEQPRLDYREELAELAETEVPADQDTRQPVVLLVTVVPGVVMEETVDGVRMAETEVPAEKAATE